jgi:hypothetical protein
MNAYPQSKGRIEPFVTVVGPRVRQLHAPQEMAILAARGRPQTERPIDMHPGAMAARDWDQIGEGIERTDVEVAGLQHDNGGLSPATLRRALERARFELTLFVARQCRDGPLSKSENSDGTLDRTVTLAAYDDADRGGAGEALLLDIPARSLEQPMAGRARTGQMGHLGASDEGKTRCLRQAKQLF